MFPVFLFPASFSITVATLRLALDQPILPGKLILWTLLMLSLVSWAVLVSKAMSFRRFRKSDIRFTKRLRRSRATLEVFEEGWKDSNSLHHDIYLTGAKEAAFQLLGSRTPDPAIHNRIKKAGKLSRRQIESLNAAIKRGLEAASARLEIGLSLLRITAVTAPLIGLTGMVWMLMRGFDVAKTFEEIAPWVSGSLTYLVFSLMVSIPAIIGLLVFRAAGKDRKRELSDYTVEITRLFERSFAASESTLVPQQSTEEVGVDDEPASAKSRVPDVVARKKEYHSIRETAEEGVTIFGSPNESVKNTFKSQGEIPINPIAQQASTMQHAYSPAFE